MIRVLFGVVALVLTASCAFNGPPVPVSGTAADLEQLAGEWRGNYFGDVNHARRGTVMFRLVAGEDHAHGDVVMTAEGLDRPYHAYQPSQPLGSPQAVARSTRALAIRFVRAADGMVSGALESYWDPERSSDALTVFRGKFVDSETIEGTFTTRYATGTAATKGTWKVTRASLVGRSDR